MQDLLQSSDMGQKQRFKENSHKQKHNLLNSQVRSSIQNGHVKSYLSIFFLCLLCFSLSLFNAPLGIPFLVCCKVPQSLCFYESEIFFKEFLVQWWLFPFLIFGCFFLIYFWALLGKSFEATTFSKIAFY